MFYFDLKRLSSSNRLNVSEKVRKSERSQITGTLLSSLIEKTIREHVPDIQIVSIGGFKEGNYSGYSHPKNSIEILTFHAPRGVRFGLEIKSLADNHPLMKALLGVIKEYGGAPVTTSGQPG